MPKISFLGAGSTVFAKNLLGDILSYPELADATISLHDIDPERLRTTEIVAQRIARTLGAKPTIEASLDRRAIAGWRGLCHQHVPDRRLQARHGGRLRDPQEVWAAPDHRRYAGHRRDHARPAHHPGLLDVCKDMEELCPDVTLLNYVNPMAMITWAIQRASKIKTVGLCHSVQGTAEQLAEDIGVPDLRRSTTSARASTTWRFTCASSAKPQGVEDLYPRIRQVIAEGRVPDWNRVRYEVLTRLGYFVTESSEHFSEYVPWFIKRDRPDLIEKFNVPLDEYIRRCEAQIAGMGIYERQDRKP